METSEQLSPTRSSSRFVSAIQNMIAEASSGDLVSQTSVVHRSILQGGFTMLKENVGWHCPQWKVQIYLSGLSTEQYLVVVDELIPNLRSVGESVGIEVVILTAEVTQRVAEVWNSQSADLERSRKDSNGFFLIATMTNGYGDAVVPFLLFPNSIDESKQWTANSIASLEEWYLLDSNSSVPCYVLRADKLRDATSNSTLLALIASLDGCEASPDMKYSFPLNRACAETSLRQALSAESAVSKVFFLDCSDASESEGKTAALKEFIASALPESQRKQISASDWKGSVHGIICANLLAVQDLRQRWDQDGFGLGLPGDVLSEILHHAQMAQGFCDEFVGRRGLIQHALEHITGDAFDSSTLVAFKGVSCFVVGEEGTGKSALMSKLADSVFRTQSSTQRPVIIRFCNTSPGSRTGVELVRSICHQINFTTGEPYDIGLNRLTYFKLCKKLQALLHDHAVVLFVDGLDQLGNDDLARSDISFLKGFSANKDSRVVLSCRQDNPTGLCYGCDIKLSSAKVPRIVVSKFQVASENKTADGEAEEEDSDVSSMLRGLLEKRGRTLTEAQMANVLAQAAVEPSALYLKLAVKVASTWTSFQSDGTVVGGLSALLTQQLDLLEAKYGPLLTRSAIGFLAFAVEGVRDSEMEDLLSLCVQQDSESTRAAGCQLKRVHSAWWSKLRHELAGTFVEYQWGMLTLSNSLVKRIIAERFSLSERLDLQQTMARYYGDLLSVEELSSSGVARQPLSLNEKCVWVAGAKYNRRRSIEAVEHMLQAGLISEARTELCNIEAICSRLSCGDGVRLLANFSDLSHVDSSIVVEHFLRWIRRYLTVMTHNPPQNVVLAAWHQPLSSTVRSRMQEVINKYDTAGKFDAASWVRCKELGGIHDFDDMICVLTGHTKNVSAVAVSRDDRFIASGGDDHSVRIWDSYSGLIVHVCEGHLDIVTAVSFNHDGRCVVSSSRDKTIVIWDIATGLPVRTLVNHQGAVNAVQFSADGALILSGSNDKTAKIWDSATGNELLTLSGHDGSITTATFCGNSSAFVATGSVDETIKIWDSKSGVLSKTLTGHTNAVTIVRSTSDGLTLASGSRDKRVIVWDLQSGDQLKVLAGHAHKVSCLDIFNPAEGSPVLVSGSDDGVFKVWNINSGDVSREYHHPVTAITFNSTGKKVITGSYSKAICVWDIASQSFDSHEIEHYGAPNIVTALCFDGNNTQIVSGTAENTVCIWDSTTGFLRQTLKGHEWSVTAVCAYNGGKMIASASLDATIRIWDTDAFTSVMTLTGHSDGINSVCVSKDEQFLASAGKDLFIHVWDAKTGALVKKFAEHEQEILSVKFSADGKQLVTGSHDGIARVWEVESGTCRLELKGHTCQVTVASFSPNGKYVITGSSDKSLRIWSQETGVELKKCLGHSIAITCLDVNSASTEVVSGSVDKSVRVWDLESGRCLNILQGHANKVTSVAFSEDGNVIASGSTDKTIRTWDTSSGSLRV